MSNQTDMTDALAKAARALGALGALAVLGKTIWLDFQRSAAAARTEGKI